ncbi:uncharacterized protein LOC101243241 isoform X1 [Ciona intestinalis]
MKKQQPAPAFHGNFKVIVDPQLKKGQEKLVRFNGTEYSCENHGQAPVAVRDPRARVSRLWSRKERIDLPVPRYKVDENYTGDVPPREVTFSKLNDNITKQFMEQMCSKYGKLERVRVYHHPKTNKHMGLAKVVFASIKSASMCISNLHQTSIMGNIINAEIDSKGELLKHLFNKIIRGEILAETMPDVIRHTQEKPTTRPVPVKDRRKSSQEDPRRRSSSDRKSSMEQTTSSHGPKTPPSTLVDGKHNDNKQDLLIMEGARVPIHSNTKSSDNESGVSDEATRQHQNPRLNKRKVKKKKKSRKFSRNSDSDTEVEKGKKGLPMWSTELEQRIENLLSEQNRKYNLDSTSRSSSHEFKSTSSTKSSDRKYSEQSGTDNDHSETAEESDVFDQASMSIHNHAETAELIDLEDGECSGDADEVQDGRSGKQSPDIQVMERAQHETSPDTKSERVSYSPSVVNSINENSYHDNSPNQFPPSQSPHRIVGRSIPTDSINHERRHEDRRRPPSPIELRSRSPFPQERYRHGGRSPEYIDRHHFDRYPPRHRSPSFEHRHRRSPPPFELHRPRGRSPNFDHRGFHHGGYRGRMGSPGYIRPSDFPPGHPEFNRRRSPSPGFSRRRRSISPGHPRYGIRREFEMSPRRDRYRRTPPDIGRHRREPSPRFAEYDRHRRRSPGFHRDHHYHPPSSPDSRRQRDKRELPPEFQERWSRNRSQSPHHSHFRRDASPRHDSRMRRSRSNSRNRSRPRSRSPKLTDDRPYSPGDLAVEDNIESDVAIHTSVSTDAVESFSDSANHKKGRRKNNDSSDVGELQQISLDERLREMTGEAPDGGTPPHSPLLTEAEVPVSDNHQEDIPDGSDDMEISSGGSTHSPHLQEKQNFHPNQQSWQYNQQEMWNGFDPRFHLPNQQPMWCPPTQRFPHNVPNGFIRPFMPDCPIDMKMLPPPPPGWNNRPWVQGQPGVPHMSHMPPPFLPPLMQGLNQIDNTAVDNAFAHCALNKVAAELKEIMKKDLNRKVIESMAFKVYEAWWDEQYALKNPKPAALKKTTVPQNQTNIKTEANINTEQPVVDKVKAESKPAGKLPALLNTFDPLNWAKGSMEMDGFRIGLGLRSAISKMPSFRVKKPTPSFDEKSKLIGDKSKAETKSEQEVQRRKRIRQTLDSEGEEDDESDYSDVDDKKSKIIGRLDVDEVFSTSSSSQSSEDEDDDQESSEEESDEGSDEDVEPMIGVKRTLHDDVRSEPPKKKKKDNMDEVKIETEVSKPTNRSDDVIKAASMLSELQSGKSLLPPSAPANVVTSQTLKHVHPKKRFRLLSTDASGHEISERLRSDDELSAMSDKEKAALEVLTDMKSTPERRLSTVNRLSSSDSSDQPIHPTTPGRQHSEVTSVFSPPLTPAPSSRSIFSHDTHPSTDMRIPITPGSDTNLSDRKKSDSKELEAVQALLSIKESQPPIPPLSPPTPVSTKHQPLKKRADLRLTIPPKRSTSVLTQEDKDRMTALAEEHNYFATSPRVKPTSSHIHPSLLQILEEHNYSCPPSQAPKTPLKKSQDEATFLHNDVISTSESPASAAELVKLRHGDSKMYKKIKQRTDQLYYEEKIKRSLVGRFRERTHMDDMRMMYNIWDRGLDVEDMKYLRQEYEDMLTNPGTGGWVNDTHWVPHPATYFPDENDALTTSPDKRNRRKRRQARKDDISDIKPHKTGCARSEGFYKVNDNTKLIQRKLMYRQADNTPQPKGRSKYANESASTSGVATEKSRETRHMMRRIASEFGSDASDLLKYNQLMYRKKSVKFKRSHIHGWGLFAEETIGADEMVIEYVGQLVRSLIADRREVDYTRRGIGSSYLFRIDSDHIIDATKCGNFARFMNHSCNPSCYAKVIAVDGAKKIVIYSKDTIKPTDEITYDYKFPIEDVKIPCFCGAPNCRGTLN